MTLTAIDPNDPIPSDRREFFPGSGPNIGPGTSRDVIIYANKTTSGTETVETIGEPVRTGTDCLARFGNRSEAYWAWWAYTQIDKSNVNIFICAPLEAAGGTAATVLYTFGATNADVATAPATATVWWAGRSVTFVINVGDTTATQAAAMVAAVNNADQGQWPFTAAQGTTTNTHKVTLTSANVGDRGIFWLSGTKVTLSQSTGNDIAKAAVTNGTGTDDHTNAYAAAALKGEFFYHISAKTSTGAVTASDNGVGELVFNINQSITPRGAKSQTCYFGLVGTQGQAATTATSSGANSFPAFFFRARNSPWAPIMIAAHCAAAVRVAQIAYPAANLNGYTHTEATPFLIPPPDVATDQPGESEVAGDLNNGVSSISFDQHGRPTLRRFVTSKSLTGTATDYRVREGHIPSVIFFAWAQTQLKWSTQKQPNVDDELPKGQTPAPLTVYPSTLKQIAFSVIDDLASARPVGSLYPGPILNPSSVPAMKKSVVPAKIPGGISLKVDWLAVEHMLRTEWSLREVSPPQ